MLAYAARFVFARHLARMPHMNVCIGARGMRKARKIFTFFPFLS
jgi:hypothetical protein